MPEMKHWREDPDEELARLIPTNKLTDFWTTNIPLERVPADIRADGGVARMSNPTMIQEIIDCTSTAESPTSSVLSV